MPPEDVGGDIEVVIDKTCGDMLWVALVDIDVALVDTNIALVDIKVAGDEFIWRDMVDRNVSELAAPILVELDTSAVVGCIKSDNC